MPDSLDSEAQKSLHNITVQVVVLLKVAWDWPDWTSLGS